MSDIQKIKKSLLPEEFYNARLNGSLGKHTGNDWCLWNGLCPFHADKKAGSFYINRKTGAFKCFSCGAGGGSVIDFHMKVNGLSFKESFKALGDYHE